MSGATTVVAMTSGTQLMRWCQDNGVKDFIGVFCSNRLPSVPLVRKRWCGIVNHSPCPGHTNGTHWLGFIIDGNKAEWFDSFGQPPWSPLENLLLDDGDPAPHFMAWLRRMGVDHVRYNASDLQSANSDVCGLYAAYFCRYGLPGTHPNAWRFLSIRSSKTSDARITQLVRIPTGVRAQNKRKRLQRDN